MLPIATSIFYLMFFIKEKTTLFPYFRLHFSTFTLMLYHPLYDTEILFLNLLIMNVKFFLKKYSD